MSMKLEMLEIKSQKLILDFSRNNYITVSAKQYDLRSRYIVIQLANNGQPVALDSNFLVQVKMLTPDNRAILETIPKSNIQEDGTLLLELTESMLYAAGKAEAEINIYDIQPYGSSRLLSTMNFNVLINASPYSEDRVVDSDEFNALVELFEKAYKDYTYVIEEARKSADAAATSASEALKSENDAKLHSNIAKAEAKEAKAFSVMAQDYAISAGRDAADATSKAKESSDYANLSKSYTVGTGGTIREGDDEDNAKHYYEKTKTIASTMSTEVVSETEPDTQVAGDFWLIPY